MGSPTEGAMALTWNGHKVWSNRFEKAKAEGKTVLCFEVASKHLVGKTGYVLCCDCLGLASEIENTIENYIKDHNG